VEQNHPKDVSIKSLPRGVKTKPEVRLTSPFDSAMIYMCGGDELRAEYGRMTSLGGHRVGSQLRNRPLWSVSF